MNRINFKRFSTNKIQIIHFIIIQEGQKCRYHILLFMIIIQGGQECRYQILLFMIHLKNDDLLWNLYIFILF